MNTIRCPMCNEVLPESALFCAHCGESITSPGHKSIHYRIDEAQGGLLERPLEVDASDRAITLKLARFYPPVDDEANPLSEDVTHPEMAISSPRKHSGAQTIPLPRPPRRAKRRDSDSEWQEIKRPLTWHKDVAPSLNRVQAPPPPPRPLSSRIPMLKTCRMRRRFQHIPPVLFLWMSMLLLILVAFGGVFGVVATLGRGIDDNTRHNKELSLQANPTSAAVGATVTLSGVNFSPHGNIGLSRDTAIPIMDTSNSSTLEADDNGNFSDTIAISTDWESGLHTLNAEDASKHKVASFSVIITGHATSLRPAHLRVSTDALDLGTGDQALNTTQTITLTNAGGGQISWQSSSTQAWLTLSPDSGTFFSGHTAQIKAAIDRSKLSPGTYDAQINILSNAGSSTLAVKADVTPLMAKNTAVLQLYPALLSFTALDGGSPPSVQTVTISNPGLQPLKWQAATSADWLNVSPPSASIDPLGNMPVSIGVDTSNLLPGTYNGMVVFSAQGSVTDNLQSIEVTITVLPQCSLQVSPGLLSFAGVYRQPSPAPKMINVGSSCSSPTTWKAVSNASWLTIDTGSGTVPATPLIGVNVSGLAPGTTYSSSIIFSSSTGTQTLPVTFTFDQGAVPLVTTAPTVMVFNGASGQASPPTQKISITNNGNSGTFTWKAQATTAIGGNWLAVTPATGTLANHQSATLNITANVLSTLVPGTYKGIITITGVDQAGNTVLGSPQTIPISLIVKPRCTIASTPMRLNFAGSSGQSNLPIQQFTIQASTACTNPLHWTASVTTTSGGNWLTATTAGTATPINNGVVKVGIASTNLSSGNYAGTIKITITDSVTKQMIGSPQVVPIAFSVQPVCTLQALSANKLAFTTAAGGNPAPQTFTAHVVGACNGNVTIAPTVTYTSGNNWLTVVASTTSVPSGGTVTFTVTSVSAGLSAHTYAASISLAGMNNGVAITGSPQAVAVTLNVTPPQVIEPTPTPTPTPIPQPTLTPTSVPPSTPISITTPSTVPTANI